MASEAKELLDYVADELHQLSEEGCDTWEMERQVELLRGKEGPGALKKVQTLEKRLAGLTPSADFSYEEPSELDAIRAVRPSGPRHLAVPLSAGALADRTLGAWQGRIAGCMLGKPVEGWTRDKIRDLLDICGMATLDDYIPECPENNRGVMLDAWRLPMLRGHFTRALRDDDTDYTIVGLCILERHGREFTPRQVAEFWLEHLPYTQTYTAERAAYRNLVAGIWPPESARVRNPYREWIGAQIRADAFGYVCPGRPEEAAGLAFKDAAVSHVKNGIYGEMWVAAMLAAALVADDVRKVLPLGLSEIPENCRLAEAIRNVIAWHGDGLSAEQATDRLLAELGRYHGVHTINNAAIVAMALLWGDGDFTRTIDLAVRAGLDTDCNGATAGSVLGAVIGARAIPDHWIAPLNDRVGTAVFGQADQTITGLAARTRELQRVG